MLLVTVSKIEELVDRRRSNELPMDVTREGMVVTGTRRNRPST